MPYFYRNNIKYSGGSDSVDLTMAEYKELEANGKVVQDITYYIIDADENIPSRPNLLINSNFINPVNQRGITNHTEATIVGHGTYTIDRWRVVSNTDGSVTMDIVDGGVKITPNINNGFFKQYVESLPNGIYSLSAKANGKIYSCTFDYDGTYVAYDFGDGFSLRLSGRETNDAVDFMIGILNGYSFTLEWAKLELGEHATPYVPRLYMEEVWLCQRYFQILQNNYKLMYITENVIAFRIPTVTHHIRTKGKATLVSPTISLNGVSQIGFTFEVGSVGFASVSITVSKSSHGITVNDIPVMGGYVELDAEI